MASSVPSGIGIGSLARIEVRDHRRPRSSRRTAVLSVRLAGLAGSFSSRSGRVALRVSRDGVTNGMIRATGVSIEHGERAAGSNCSQVFGEARLQIGNPDVAHDQLWSQEVWTVDARMSKPVAEFLNPGQAFHASRQSFPSASRAAPQEWPADNARARRTTHRRFGARGARFRRILGALE
jgi:hypothetical protein